MSKVIYLGRSRLHRNRANLLQTLHTCAALHAIGVPLELNLPPWHRLDLDARLRDILGFATPLQVRPRQLLHRRWSPRWLARLERRRLQQAAGVYLRDAELSLALADAGIRHHFEVHQVRALQEAGQLGDIVRFHRAGRIGWLVPISRAAADALAAAGADPERMHIAPSGVAIEAYAAIPSLTADDIARPRALYIGRISRSRGLDVLLNVAERGLTELLLVGEQDDPVPQRRGVEARGFVAPAQVPRLYGEAGLVLLPYQPSLPHSDAISPLKLFEAMAAGRVIIASDLPPIREVVDHGRTGLLVPADDPAAWARAVERIKADPAEALAMAANARAEAARFSWRQRALDIAVRLDLPRAVPA